MSDLSRQNSPKSSPRGSRSPAYPRQDSSGTLKTTISLGKMGPSIVHTGPFYLMKELPEPSELTGATNLMAHYGLEHSYHKFNGKKLKEELSAFLPHLPGNIDQPGSVDNSSLRSIIEKPPITGKELHTLDSAALAGFRLHPGPLPENYHRLFNQPVPQKRKKHKKHRKEGKELPQETQGGADAASESGIDHKKRKEKNKDDAKKKEKKKKKKKEKKEKEKDEKPVV